MKTWAECHAAGMTLNQAVKSTGQRRNTGTSWATRNGVSWPDSAPHADRQSVRTGYIPGPSKAQHSTAPVSIPRAPWGDIEIDARSDTAPRNDGLLAGVNVLLLVIFAIAVMDGVTARLWVDPAGILGLLLLACIVGLVAHLIGFLAFRRGPSGTALSAALLSGNRNMGLMLAVTGGSAGMAFDLYVGIAQIPMYFAPLLLTPFVARRQASAGQARR